MVPRLNFTAEGMMNRFGEEVKRFLKFHGFKHYQLAKQIGLHQAHLSKILNDWFPIRAKMRSRIQAGMKELAEKRNDE